MPPITKSAVEKPIHDYGDGVRQAKIISLDRDYFIDSQATLPEIQYVTRTDSEYDIDALAAERRAELRFLWREETQDALGVGRTVRSGIAFDINSENAVSYADAERAEKIKEELGAAQLLGLEKRPVYRFIKQAFDIAFSGACIVTFSWLFALIAIAIKIDDPAGLVLFRQMRVTKDGREFTMLKFRSMCVDAEERLAELKEFNEKGGPVFKIADDPRITRVEKVIRKLSFDELPQFFNVLKGDMSLVGPRPALSAEVETYTSHQRQRLLMKGGLTCYLQTRRNRGAITFDEWIDFDLLYIKKCNAWVDFKLIVQTLDVVLTA